VPVTSRFTHVEGVPTTEDGTENREEGIGEGGTACVGTIGASEGSEAVRAMYWARLREGGGGGEWNPACAGATRTEVGGCRFPAACNWRAEAAKPDQVPERPSVLLLREMVEVAPGVNADCCLGCLGESKVDVDGAFFTTNGTGAGGCTMMSLSDCTGLNGVG